MYILNFVKDKNHLKQIQESRPSEDHDHGWSGPEPGHDTL